MKTLEINGSDKINKNFVAEIAELLMEGKIVILPTGTVYGLSCKYDDSDSIDKIHNIKRRNKNQPFIILISRLDDLKKLVSDMNPKARKIIKKFWDIKDPKPLTLIFKKNSTLDSFITGGSANIAIRLADTGFLREIINICGPIVSTSATISGIKTYPKKIENIPPEIRKQVDLIVENTYCLAGIESTIVDVTGETPVLVREGAVKMVF
jgi:L-threonylcarbamoyladenylate synthase